MAHDSPATKGASNRSLANYSKVTSGPPRMSLLTHPLWTLLYSIYFFDCWIRTNCNWVISMMHNVESDFRYPIFAAASVFAIFSKYAFLASTILSLLFIGYRLYIVTETVHSAITKDTEVMSFKFDDVFDRLTDEKKAEYLKTIAAATEIDDVETNEFRKGSVIVDIKVDKQTAERIMKNREAIGKAIGAEIEMRSHTTTIDESSNILPDSTYQKSHQQHHHVEYTTTDEMIQLQSGDHIETDRGLFALAQVSGTIFHDTNANGIYESASDRPIQGVTVSFVRASGEVISEKVTDRSGQYQFSEKEPGDYYVSIHLPHGRMFSPMVPKLVLQDYQNRAGRARVIYTNIDPGHQGNSSIFSLNSGSSSTEINAGLYGPANVTGFLWEDIYGTTVFNPGDTRTVRSLPDAFIELELHGDYSDEPSIQVPLTANGNFTVANLLPGTYSVRITLPPDHHFVTRIPETITILSEQSTYLDIGFYRTIVISGSIYEDLNAAGWITGKQTEARRNVRGATISIRAEHQVTIENNNNLRKLGVLTVPNTIVSQNGEYSFKGFAPGSYQLHFTPPNSYKIPHRITKPKLDEIRKDDPEALSCDTENGSSSFRLIPSGGEVHITSCMYTLATIGGYVWEDRNANGIFEKDLENVIPGVDVRLYDADGRLVAESTTNEKGHYIFRNLEPGKYQKPQIVPPPHHQLSNARTSFQYVPADDPRLID